MATITFSVWLLLEEEWADQRHFSEDHPVSVEWVVLEFLDLAEIKVQQKFAHREKLLQAAWSHHK